MSEDRIADYLASRALVRVLEDWCQPFAPGSSFIYPSRRQQPAALSALINALRLLRDHHRGSILLMSVCGGAPKRRLYSRLNCEALSYPTRALARPALRF